MAYPTTKETYVYMIGCTRLTLPKPGTVVSGYNMHKPLKASVPFPTMHHFV